MMCFFFDFFFFFQAEDGIRDLVRSRGLGDVYKRQQRDGQRVTGRHDEVEVARRLRQQHLQAADDVIGDA